jgi:8-oxo-dGTP pyrophosphatase MutT (NUDIX family)
MRNRKNKINGAGLVAMSYDMKKVLTLWVGEKLDLPKGAIERGETAFQAAFREAYEEAGIREEDCELVSDQPGIFDNIQFYYVFWNGIPTISRNPKTGILEHDNALWLPWRKAIDKSPEFLKPALFHGLALTAVMPHKKRS